MNKMLSSERKFQDFKTPLRKVRYQILQTKLVELSLSADKFSVLKPHCGLTDKQETECRKAEVVDLYIDAINAGIALSSIPDIMSCDNFATDAATLII